MYLKWYLIACFPGIQQLHGLGEKTTARIQFCKNVFLPKLSQALPFYKGLSRRGAKWCLLCRGGLHVEMGMHPLLWGQKTDGPITLC